MHSSADGKLAAFMIGTATIVALDGIQHGKFSPKTFVGVLVAYLMLSFLASTGSPELAVAFAFLVFIAVFLRKGPGVLEGLTAGQVRIGPQR